MIVPPKQGEDNPDRSLDCQSALEHRLRHLIYEAEEAGWEREEIENALLRLVIAEMRLNVCTRETERAIAAASRSVEGED